MTKKLIALFTLIAMISMSTALPEETDTVGTENEAVMETLSDTSESIQNDASEKVNDNEQQTVEDIVQSDIPQAETDKEETIEEVQDQNDYNIDDTSETADGTSDLMTENESEDAETQQQNKPSILNERAKSGIVTMGVGEELQLETNLAADMLSFKSSISKIVGISSTGKIKAKNPGRSQVTVTNTTTKDFITIKVIVVAAPKSKITITPKYTVLGVGETTPFTISYSGYVDYSYDNTLLEQTASGFRALKETSDPVVVEVTAYNGVKGQFTINAIKAAPSIIKVEKTEITLAKGDSYRLIPGVGDNECCNVFKYVSGNTDIVSYDFKTNKLIAKSIGRTTVIVSTYNCDIVEPVTVVVNVVASVKSIEFVNVTHKKIGSEEKLQLYPIITLNNNNKEKYKVSGYIYGSQYENLPELDTTLTWSISSTKYATVNDHGLVTAKNVTKSKAVSVTVKAYNSKKGCTIKLTILKAIKTLKVSMNKTTLSVGDSTSYSINFGSGEGGGYQITFEGDGEVLTNNGKLTAVQEGTVKIIVKTYNDIQQSITVNILPALTEDAITLEPNSATIEKGDTYKIPTPVITNGAVSDFTYTTSNKKVATVDKYGKVKALNTGTVTITVKAYNGITRKFTLKIVKSLSVKIEFPEKNLMLGKNYKINVTFGSGTADNYKTMYYNSSNEKVLTVDSNGNITPVAIGSAIVTVKSYNGKIKKSQIYNVTHSCDLTADKTENVTIGDKIDFDVYFDGVPADNYVIMCDGDSIIQNIDGSWTVVGYGVTKITATVNEKYTSNVLTFVNAPSSINLTLNGIENAKPGSIITYSAESEGVPIPIELIDFSLSDESWVSIDKKSGTATIKQYGEYTLNAYYKYDDSINTSQTILIAPSAVDFKLINTSYICNGDRLRVSVLFDGTEMPYSLGMYSYIVSDDSIITVDDLNGKITTCGVGSAVIYVQPSDKYLSLGFEKVGIQVLVHDQNEKPILTTEFSEPDCYVNEPVTVKVNFAGWTNNVEPQTLEVQSIVEDAETTLEQPVYIVDGEFTLQYDTVGTYSIILTGTDANGISYDYDCGIFSVYPVISDENFDYELKNNTLIVIRYKGKASKVTIPKTVSGYSVSAIGKNVFANNTTLVSITLPSTLKKIGKSAFEGCTALQSVKSNM